MYMYETTNFVLSLAVICQIHALGPNVLSKILVPTQVWFYQARLVTLYLISVAIFKKTFITQEVQHLHAYNFFSIPTANSFTSNSQHLDGSSNSGRDKFLATYRTQNLSIIQKKKAKSWL